MAQTTIPPQMRPKVTAKGGKGRPAMVAKSMPLGFLKSKKSKGSKRATVAD